MQECEAYAPVPELFWSLETGKPFAKCTLCGGAILKPGTNYAIQKSYNGREPVFECAICLTCDKEIQKQVSKKSMQLVHHYFDEHVDFRGRAEKMLSLHGMDCIRWINECVIKGTPRDDCKEYIICGWCIDEDMAYINMPFLISGEAVDEMMSLLSQQTKGILDGINDQLFGADIPQGMIMI